MATGIAAATFRSDADRDENASYPQFLPIIIVSVAVSVLVIANAALGKFLFMTLFGDNFFDYESPFA
jgi:hypothetical protein